MVFQAVIDVKSTFVNMEDEPLGNLLGKFCIFLSNPIKSVCNYLNAVFVANTDVRIKERVRILVVLGTVFKSFF